MTADQMLAFQPYWRDVLEDLTKSGAEEIQARSNWAERMFNDSEYANVWLSKVKMLWDLEDTNQNGYLEREEFESFYKKVRAVMFSGQAERLAEETTP